MASKSDVIEFIHNLILNSDYDIDQVYELSVEKFSGEMTINQIGELYQTATNSLPELN